MQGIGYYLERGSKFSFEIEIHVADGKLTGRIYGEDSLCQDIKNPEAQIDGEMTGNELRFKKVYSDGRPIIYYKLSKDGERYRGGWSFYEHWWWDNDFVLQKGEAEIIIPHGD